MTVIRRGTYHKLKKPVELIEALKALRVAVISVPYYGGFRMHLGSDEDKSTIFVEITVPNGLAHEFISDPETLELMGEPFRGTYQYFVHEPAEAA